MQINRAFEIVYILLGRGTVTAKELAEHFGVSQRTIYRDLDILSSAGIPVYTNRGSGGGICLLDNFVLNKSVVSPDEQNEILLGLQTLKAAKYPDIQGVINKLGAVFNKDNVNWIEVDFSNWGAKNEDREKFNILKTAIIKRREISFGYFSSYSETARTVKPLKLVFKGQAWYLQAYCNLKQSFRTFKISRMKNVLLTDNYFEPISLPYKPIDDAANNFEYIKLTLNFNRSAAFRVFDEFDERCVTHNADGSFTVNVSLPHEEWLYGYLLSYGSNVKVIEPKQLRDNLLSRIKSIIDIYTKL